MNLVGRKSNYFYERNYKRRLGQNKKRLCKVKPECEDEQEIIIVFNEIEKGKRLLANLARNQLVLRGIRQLSVL